MKNLRAGAGAALIISAAVCALFVLLTNLHELDTLEVKTLDSRFRKRAERKFPHKEVSDAVKVIAIDADGINQVGRWPWPRGVIARMISGVCGSGEAAMDDEGWEDAETEEGWEDAPAADASAAAAPTNEPEATETQALDELEEEAAADKKKSASTFEIKGTAQVLALDILFDRADRDYSKYLFRDGAMMSPKEQDAMAVDALKNCEAVVLAALFKWVGTEMDLGLGDESLRYKLNGNDVILNMPLSNYRLENVTTGVINMQPSRFDERVRKTRLYYKPEKEDDYIFSFPVMALASYLGVTLHDIKVVEGRSVTIGDIVIPVDEHGDIYINYRGKEYSAGKDGYVSKDNIFSVKDVMADPEAFSMLQSGPGIFLVGMTDPELKDVFFTPYQDKYNKFPNNAVMSGVEIHKEVIDTILQGDFLRDATMREYAPLIFIICLAVCAGCLIHLWGGIAAGAAAGGIYYYLIAVERFSQNGVIYPVVAPLLAIPVSFAASILYRNLALNKEKNAVKNIFKSYVSPHVLAELMENPNDLKLGGKKSRVSVLFSDIRGFTTISENLEPDILIKGLNHYLGEMTGIILESSGMIDKFIGDAVMGVWGAPLPKETDTRNAVSAAMKMEKSLNEIRPRVLELWGNKPGLDIQIGVGINTGDATLGNIGSAGKLDYTVIGDTVNLASRLEGLTKAYGAFLIISENTYADVKDHFECCVLDRVKVKGKDLPVAIYQVLGDRGSLDEKTARYLDIYNRGLALYLDRKWTEAIAAFKAGLDADPSRKVCHLYIERCEYFMDSPPPDNWDGSFAWKTK